MPFLGLLLLQKQEPNSFNSGIEILNICPRIYLADTINREIFIPSGDEFKQQDTGTKLADREDRLHFPGLMRL